MKRGFTLVELLISVALFSVVMVVALGALVALSSAARKAENINTAVNNLSGSIDSMTRTIRTGADYYCGKWDGTTPWIPTNCVSGGFPAGFSFINADGNIITYCLSDGSSNCSNNPSCAFGNSCSILRRTCYPPSLGKPCTGYIPITSSEVNITQLVFAVRNTARTDLSDYKQPVVLMYLVGKIQTTAKQSTPFQLQTSVTQRIYDQ
jgi:prepilin-type N-terminal cleavage/methylation domain-containing protein